MKSLSINTSLATILLANVIAIAGGNKGMSSMDFLNIDVSARSAASGEALLAVSGGPMSAFYNPAGLAAIGNIQVAGTHSEWLQDLRHEYLGAAFPIGSKGGLAVSLSYLSLGEIKGFSSTNTAAGNLNAYDVALAISYGSEIAPSFSAGASLKGIGERLADVTAYGFATDLGAQYHLRRIDIGMAARNIGPRVKYAASSSALPASINAGISVRPFGDDLAFMMGTSIPFAGDPGILTGIEYTYLNLLVLRGGFDAAGRTKSGGGMSFGCGLNIFGHSLDYAYNVNDILGGTHQITFILRFSQVRRMAVTSGQAKNSPENGSIASNTQSIADSASKQIYLVCVGRYKSRADAEKYAEALQKFGYSPKLSFDGQSVYRVVVGKAGERPKAEKIKMDFEKKGISCSIEEE